MHSLSFTLIHLFCVLLLAGCPDAGKQIEPAVKPGKPVVPEKPVKPVVPEKPVKPVVKPAPYSFSFGVESHKMAFTKGGTYTRVVIETNKLSDDKRDITYTSSEDKIATVDSKGVVTFKTAGTIAITATKEKGDGHAEVTDSYILYITTKPTDHGYLSAEIWRAISAHGYEVDLNYIDISAVTNMESLFAGFSVFNPDISKWDVSKVTNMNGMFSGAAAFDQDISGWDVSNVTNMSSMFAGAAAFNQDISRWKVSNVTNMESMFNEATAFNQNISGWDVSKVTTMRNMFWRARAFNQDISRWKVSKVTDMSYMFDGAGAFGKNLNAWGTRINESIKARNWAGAKGMFRNSGLAASLPSWCNTVQACKNAAIN